MSVIASYRNTCWLTALHATVDALCACSMFVMELLVHADGVVRLFVLYNVLAFMGQPLVGWWMDKRQTQGRYLVAAVVLLVSGALTTHAALAVAGLGGMLFVPVSLLGAGNALFHVFGGKTLAQQTGNDQRRLGIFVASGAFGIWLGARNATMVMLYGLVVLLIFSLWGYLRGEWTADDRMQCAETDNGSACSPHVATGAGIGQATRWFLALIVLIVFVRSFMGQLDPAQERWSPRLLTIAMTLAVAGKAMGGYLAQWWGTKATLVVALLLSGIFFLLGYYHCLWLLGLVWCLNVTMPLTLGLANSALPGREGLAFGLLACVLAPGVALATLSSGQPLVYLLLYALVGTLVIEELVLLALRERRWQVLGVGLVMNLLTNLPLNLYLLTQFPAGYPIGWVVGLEVGVVLLEAFLYWLVMRDVRRSVGYALCCNLASCLLPMLFFG